MLTGSHREAGEDFEIGSRTFLGFHSFIRLILPRETRLSEEISSPCVSFSSSRLKSGILSVPGLHGYKLTERLHEDCGPLSGT